MGRNSRVASRLFLRFAGRYNFYKAENSANRRHERWHRKIKLFIFKYTIASGFDPCEKFNCEPFGCGSSTRRKIHPRSANIIDDWLYVTELNQYA